MHSKQRKGGNRGKHKKQRKTERINKENKITENEEENKSDRSEKHALVGYSLLSLSIAHSLAS